MNNVFDFNKYEKDRIIREYIWWYWTTTGRYYSEFEIGTSIYFIKEAKDEQ